MHTAKKLQMGTRKLFKAWRGSGPDGSPGSWHFREMARMRGRPVYFLDHFPTTCIWEMIEALYAELVTWLTTVSAYRLVIRSMMTSYAGKADGIECRITCKFQDLERQSSEKAYQPSNRTGYTTVLHIVRPITDIQYPCRCVGIVSPTTIRRSVPQSFHILVRQRKPRGGNGEMTLAPIGSARILILRAHF
jgi:hypothetical protein